MIELLLAGIAAWYIWNGYQEMMEIERLEREERQLQKEREKRLRALGVLPQKRAGPHPNNWVYPDGPTQKKRGTRKWRPKGGDK